MKKLTKKLSLNRETLRVLSNDELREVAGGTSESSACLACNRTETTSKTACCLRY